VKRIGLLGGMSWESSIEYYRLVNEEVRARLGGLHSADCLLRSVDFAPVEELQRSGHWAEAGELLAAEAQALVAAGAELLVLCTNTMHKVADAIMAAVDVPFVHIADTTADAVRAASMTSVGLLATAYTMEQDFYVGRLQDEHGLTVLVPKANDRRLVHDVIYRELCVGIVKESSRREYRRVMSDLSNRGADCILFGCTEIDLLVGRQDSPVPVFDTTRLHAQKAVQLALEGNAAQRPLARSGARPLSSAVDG
jgi:aspartate racemase